MKSIDLEGGLNNLLLSPFTLHAPWCTRTNLDTKKIVTCHPLPRIQKHILQNG